MLRTSTLEFGHDRCVRGRRTRLTTLALLMLMMILTGVGGPAFAQPQRDPMTSPSATQGPQDQFVPVKTLPAQEQLPAPTLVMLAYGFVWAALLLYVWTIWRRLMKVEREMHDLAARLGEKR